MRKTGEFFLTTKYPVTDALVRMCSVKTGPHALEQQNLVCTSLLRCLLEHNGDRFVLSPWIAACALTASDRVLRTLWRELLYHSFNAEDTFSDEKDLNWRMDCPAQQIVELLAEEGKLRVCRLTWCFVELLLTDDILKERLVELRSYLIFECLMRAFRHAITYWSMSLMVEWLERRRKHHPEGGGGVFKELVDFLARFTLKLSVKKPEWFINHILSFILSSQCPTVEQEPALRVILRTYAPFVFGGIDLQWLDPKSRQNGYFEISATSIRTSEDLDSLRSNIELLIGLLIVVDACIKKEEYHPGVYVYSLLCVFIQKTIDKHSALDHRLERFTIRVCQAYYRRLSHHLGQDSKRDDVSIKFSEALNLLFHSECPVAGVLLHEVVGILAGFEKGNTHQRLQYLAMLCGTSRVETSGKRDVVQKSLVAYESAAPATSRSSSTTIAQDIGFDSGETGELTRRVLSSERVVRLFAHLLNVGRLGRKQEILLDMVNVVMRKNAFANQEETGVVRLSYTS
ncbi:hypothetical protein PsorP6_005046 [Peronosclerospora sorghi]|uniref:Uncharacterized protein n=1 Tax=Peronosclerospora sorghi TaxID=230839 RepID=A0ACC0W6J6_9STRA|nr:hypothetical protein PsorP6_005046 [Peronosclerospora sorghi]